ncbi:MAG TPA: thiamine-phosphate kinase [Thermoanaerobaculia bacterium]|nr:thiamine-phosphate kinase [Thermoanaerobaculia bacterium]
MTEQKILTRMRRLFPDIGDDAAVVGDEVITTDLLIEDVDFTASVPLRFVARKSLTVNLSDVAAMGATPAHAVVALGLPPWADVDVISVALAEKAIENGVRIVGGDLSRAEKLIICITATGKLLGRPLLRSGARRGDWIYVSRPIGGSAAGLTLLQHGWKIERDGAVHPPKRTGRAQIEFASSAIRHHVDPEAEVKLGPALAAIPEVSSCIDLSDGLSTDLHNLCDASACGAEIDRERIPVFPDLLTAGPSLGVRPQEAVLHGGEEFALLFTASLGEQELRAKLGRAVHAIGRITEGRDVVLKGEGVLGRGGFDHFG